MIEHALGAGGGLPAPVLADCAVAVGSFDGLHLGHRALIDAVGAARDRLGLKHACLFTFREHPRQVLDATQPALLTSWNEKLALLDEMDVDVVVAADFCPALSRLSYDDFVRRFLVEFLGMRHLVGGHDVHLGNRRGGTETTLAALADALGFGFQAVPALTLAEGLVPSSSAIRRALADGEVGLAARLLGRPYSLWGEVGYGAGRGAGIGFPTANVAPLEAAKAVPAPGVYAVWVHLPSDVITAGNADAVVARRRGALPEVDGRGDLLNAPGLERAVCRGALNYGRAPTVHAGGLEAPRLEVHVLDFSGYIRERSLKLEWIARLRDERTFSSPDALREQLRLDTEAARAALIAPAGG
jgi:riboflavin kinase/FMN adenylyltransferase